MPRALPPDPSRPLRALTNVVLLLALTLCTASASAQCEGRWLNSPAQIPPGVDGNAYTALKLPNGDIVVAGSFMGVGGAAASNVARWNGATWSAMGGPFDLPVNCLAVLPNGDLIAGGRFTTINGVTVNRIARWDGATWQPFGTGVSGEVFTLYPLPNGDILAGGSFGFAGTVVVNNIARWDGATWRPMAAGLGGGWVVAIAAMPSGEIVAGGGFVGSGTQTIRYIARWNGSTWGPLAGGLNSGVSALLQTPTGDLLVGGGFTQAGGNPANFVARWDGANWSPVSAGSPGVGVSRLLLRPNGDLIAIGGNRVARLSGANWSTISAFISGGVASVLNLDDGRMFAVGTFVLYGELFPYKIAAWDGFRWSNFNEGPDGQIHTLAVLTSGELVGGGSFGYTGGANVNTIARWDGMRWSPMGRTSLPVYALCVLRNGDLLAGGRFTSIDGVSAQRIARWNGEIWQPVGVTTFSSSFRYVYAITEQPNGNIVVGGDFTAIGGVPANHIAMWNGSTWSAMGSGMAPTAERAVTDLISLPNGDVIAGGNFSAAGGVPARNVARWDGASWHPMADGASSLGSLALLPTGELIAGGGFTTPEGLLRRVVKWDGVAWQALGEGPPSVALLVLPNGDVISGGSFAAAGNVLANGVARWNGSEWRPLGYGINVVPAERPVTSLAALPNGEIIAGGGFISAEGRVSAHWARWVDDPHPRIAQHPTGKPMTAGDSIDINVVPAPGYDFNGPLTYRWQRNGANLPDGALPNGTIVQGAGSDTLRLSNFHPLDAGAFRVVVYNSCGTAISKDVILAVTSDAAHADANNDGAVNALDLVELLVSLAHRPSTPGTEADLNADGVVDLRDLNLLLTQLPTKR